MIILYSGRLNPEDFNLPTDYIFAENSWGNLFYKAYTTGLNYGDAKAQCESDGTLLSIPRSQAENDFILGLFTGWANPWIGINDIEQEGSFVTVDGRELSELSWTNWLPGQPSGTGQGLDADGVEILSSGFWNDERAFVENKFVCSIDIEGIIFFHLNINHVYHNIDLGSNFHFQK